MRRLLIGTLLAAQVAGCVPFSKPKTPVDFSPERLGWAASYRANIPRDPSYLHRLDTHLSSFLGRPVLANARIVFTGSNDSGMLQAKCHKTSEGCFDRSAGAFVLLHPTHGSIGVVDTLNPDALPSSLEMVATYVHEQIDLSVGRSRSDAAFGALEA